MSHSINTEEMQALRLWLCLKREATGLSMRDLALKLDKPHTYIHKVEKGERRLDIVEFVWYCEALGVQAEEGIAIINKAKKTRNARAQKW